MVVNKFLPMANGKIWNGSTFITFALNDEKEFGNIERVSDNRESVHYCVVKSVEKHSEWLKDVIYATDQHIKCVIFCYGSKKLEEGGVYRYNTMEDLKKAGVTQVGDWRID